MSAANRDPFALARAEGDVELLAAEQSLTALHQEREQCTDDAGRREALSDELWRVHKQICQTAPTTMAGAAVKLRLLVHPNLGLDALDISEDDWVSLNQVVEFVSTAAKGGEAQP